MFGTHAVQFQPIQRAGVLSGCSIVFRAVQADHAYRRGDPVAIVGNVSVYRFDRRMAVGLKIGLKDLTVRHAPLVRPHYAYLQTKTKSTAKFRYTSNDGEEGFRVIALGIDDAMPVLIEMLEEGKALVGFNRVPDGMDVLVPIDLQVVDAEPVPPDRFVRGRSNDELTGFTGCVHQVLKDALAKPTK